jgi:hypothetical protein
MNWRKLCSIWGLGLALASSGAACGGDDDGGSGGSGGSGGEQCQAPDTYQPGISKTGEKGVTVTILESQPAPPILDDNRWRISVKGSNGQPIDQAALKIERSMPDHDGHGNAREPNVTAEGQGVYVLDPMNFNMQGRWKIKVTVTSGELSDNVAFEFCLG